MTIVLGNGAIRTGVLRIDGTNIALLLLAQQQQEAQHNKRSKRRRRHPLKANRGAQKRALRMMSNKAVQAQQIIEHAFRDHAGMSWRDVEKELRSDPVLKGFRNLQTLAQRVGVVDGMVDERKAA